LACNIKNKELMMNL